MRFDLSDAEWAIIEPLLPPTRQGGPRCDDRRILNGIFYVLRTGIPWDDVPSRYGPPTTVYNRFRRWAQQGIWQRIFDELQACHPSSLEMIDTTMVPAHRAAAGAEKGDSPAPSGTRRKRSATRGAAGPRSATASATNTADSGVSA
jgi:transposase